ncbi:MAG: hypothetical protein ACJ75I_10645 [Solirubrobacterales bacterium]
MTNTATTGRAATSRGVIDSKPRMVTIEVSGCSYCQSFEGTYSFADVPGYPPFRPNCSCTASAA